MYSIRWSHLSKLVGVASLALTTACGAAIDGIWLLELPYADSRDDDLCTTSVTHNFTDAYEPEDEEQGAWTTESATDQTGGLQFALLSELSDGTGMLVIGEQVFPGTGTKGQWTFHWRGESTSNDSTTHNSGYALTEQLISRSEVELTLTVSKSMVGTLTLAVVLAGMVTSTASERSPLRQCTARRPRTVLWDALTHVRSPTTRGLIVIRRNPGAAGAIPARSL